MATGVRGSVRVLILMVLAVAVTGVAGPGAQAPARVEPATLVLQNGKIVTVDDSRPEARAVAMRGDTIVAIGSEADVTPYIAASTTVIDLKGALAVPGIVESHGHFLGIGQAKLGLELMPTTSWDQIVGMVAEAVKQAKPGEWIVGRGWHQEKWTSRPQPNVEGFPTHESLDTVSPDNPVILTHASGHATFANARAMALAGVTRDTPNPAGGEILKDARGNPIGVFRETASGLIGQARSASRAKMTAADLEAESRRIIALADRECLSKGIATFHDAGESFQTIDLVKRVVQEGKLGVRLYVMVGDSNAKLAQNLAKYRAIGLGNNHLTIRAVKAYMDGALGSRGAWLLEPYTDLPGHAGLNTTPIEELRETAKLAMANGYQLGIHAIGDRANREVLNIYEEIFRANPAKKDLRWRDEHTQHLNAADIARFGKLGVIAAMQGIHCTSDAPYVLARLGPKRAEEGAYVWQKLMQTGAMIANGTDAPVEDVDPIPNYYATVTRRLQDGSVFYGDQKMSRMEGLKSYTINGAYAAFEENIKGSLKPGKLGDITV
ncbi:MAG: amidohydrolase, partial [Acidobacteria bacterium]|nr:amidohydrolase [Acidobacteriota bacterium]